ncbi:hypothetical protein [Rheinheimera tangshanensis]|uniref:Uncharacterized protein n=1 Tax=Rheinheimera tangshanensis TaxID=400153 RepID=A0A5C8LP17_9GAMM|nr:hypothetical protein [Rheinheimera tangshanensis]TXK77050.1 hypothetical protein FU839_18610 [Rheinheimera tangshanensis]GGM49724.1 hypothetical protein GCM10010920_07640 [Rheinheimera tangshanensis]
MSDAVSAINQGKLNSQLIADEVTSGHAFTKHVLERKEFADLGIETKEQFFSFIENIVANPAVIRREATAFRPDQGGIGWENYIKTQVPKN